MRFVNLLAVLTIALALSACGGGSTAATPTKAAGASSGGTANLSGSSANTPEASKPTATVEAKATATVSSKATATPISSSSSSSSNSKLFSDVPDYPGSTTQGSFNFSGMGLTDNEEYDKTEWRALSSKDSPDKILKYYKEELVKAKYGWTEEGWFESAGAGGMGAYSKDNENKSLALIIGKDEKDVETSIILAVGEGKKKP